MASFARGAASLTRIALSTSKNPLQLIHRCGLADHHGPPKTFWEDRRARDSLAQASASLLFFGLIFYGGYKLGAYGQGKKEEGKKEVVMPK